MTQTADKQFYTYFHTRNDTGAVFYVGKGCGDRARHVNRNNPHWRNIVAKHGHTVHIASRWSTEGEAFEHERFLILCFKDLGLRLANMTDGGEGVSGLRHSDTTKAKLRALAQRQMASAESRERLRIVNTGRSASAETRAKLSAVSRGLVRTDETKAKMSAAQTGRVHSDESKAKMRSAKVGTIASETTRAKMSASRKTWTHSDASKAKMSASSKGKIISEEQRNKIRETLTGRRTTAETKEKLSAASVNYWNSKRGVYP